MGNKDAGRDLRDMEFSDYMRNMGGEINWSSSGNEFPTLGVYKWYKLLRGYYLNRFRWLSDNIDETELKLIEWDIFHYGFCAMLRPKIIRDGVKFTATQYKIYRCQFTNINHRNGKPHTISILNQNTNTNMIIDVNYSDDEFVIFTDEYLFPQHTVPFSRIAWEYANKLYEVDLAFNANSHKNRMPFVFNTGRRGETKDNQTFNIIAKVGVGLAELMRSAFGRNEQFIEVSENMVGESGFLHEPRYIENLLPAHIETQKRLIDAYMELIGLYTSKDRKGVYVVQALQEQGDESGDFITHSLQLERLRSAQEAANKFGITLSLEVIT